MSAIDPQFDRRPMPAIDSARAVGGLVLEVKWSSGPRKGITERADLAPVINRFKFYKPLRKDFGAFSSLSVEDDGETIEWLDGELDMPATQVERLAEEQMTGKDFENFLRRHHMTRAEAAAEFGRSLRNIQDLVACEDHIPRLFALACRGLEHANPERACTRWLDLFASSCIAGTYRFGNGDMPNYRLIVTSSGPYGKLRGS